MTIDPFVYEIVRHRLWTINQEGALALQRVSGSPLATEAFDMNTSVMTGDGRVVFVGPYLLTGPMGQGLIVRKILAEYAESPRIQPGDMFICNDPYSGAAHQNCVTLVGPIHAEGRLIAWTGATLHVVDVGGPQSGQVGVGADSIHQEAPVIPPLRIVQGGLLLKDVEDNYLRRSRTPELNALDLRAKIAALNTITARVLEVVEAFGAEVVEQVMSSVIERGVKQLQARLGSLSDGTHEHTAYLDRTDVEPPETYRVHLRLEKSGESVTLDWTDSSPQAGAVVNCTRSGLWSGVLIAFLTYLGWDTAWCPAAIEQVIEIQSRSGTVVDARWPAGCSMATMAAGFAVTTATAVCLGKLLIASDASRDRAMATWAGAVGSVDVFGQRSGGDYFGTVLLDSMISGTGALENSDGIDGGGFLRSIGCVVANVETYEARFPLIYLWRRLEADTGGPGRSRGGVGCSYGVMPHGVESIEHVIPHFSGTRNPESVGLAGGYPGAINRPWVARQSVDANGGRLPTGIDDVADRLETLTGIAHLRLDRGEVFGVTVTGGGGWGDPLDRRPDAVTADVEEGLVSTEMALEVYGVVIDETGDADLEASERQRSSVRQRRQSAAVIGSPVEIGTRRVRPGPIDDNLEITSGGEVECRRCGFSTAFDLDHWSALATARRPMNAAGPHVTSDASELSLELLEVYCPGCWRLVAVERVPSEA